MLIDIRSELMLYKFYSIAYFMNTFLYFLLYENKLVAYLGALKKCLLRYKI